MFYFFSAITYPLTCAHAAILYFDHIVRLLDEIKYIWSRPRSAGSVWFFINRYLAFFGNLKGGIAPLTTSIAITMASRLVLNLRRRSAHAAAHSLATWNRLVPPSHWGQSGAVARVELRHAAADVELGPVLDIKAATIGLWSEENAEEREVEPGCDDDGAGPKRHSGGDVELKVLR